MTRPKKHLAGGPWTNAWSFSLLAAVLMASTSQGQDSQDTQKEEEKPACIFSGIAWQGASISGLGYFPDGKEDEEFIEVFLPNGGRSRKYAYYGKSPLNFYQRIEIRKDDEKGTEEEKAKPKKDSDPDEQEVVEVKYLPMVSTRLDPKVKEIFLFFFKTGEEGNPYGLESIDFSLEAFPVGTFWFFSRCRTPLTIGFGLDNGQLPPLGQALIKARPDEFGDLPIRVFQNKTNIRRKVYSTIWNFTPRARTIVFLLPTPNGVKVRRFMDLAKEEKPLGVRAPGQTAGESKPGKPQKP